jgi:hypothetical protein
MPLAVFGAGVLGPGNVIVGSLGVAALGDVVGDSGTEGVGVEVATSVCSGALEQPISTTRTRAAESFFTRDRLRGVGSR